MGFPKPNIDWFLNDRPLDFTENVYDDSRENIGNITGCLTFGLGNVRNNGKYTLKADNLYGTDVQWVMADFKVGQQAGIF